MFLNKQLLIKAPKGFKAKRKQSGSALVIAIFIIIVMTLLGTALVRMLSTTSESIAYEVIGTRAFQAAQTGLQWQLQQVFPLDNPTNAAACTAINPIPDLSTTKGLENCAVNVLCETFEVESVRYYQIQSTGQCQVAGVVTSRTLAVDARSL